jgi:hypothetical protein
VLGGHLVSTRGSYEIVDAYTGSCNLNLACADLRHGSTYGEQRAPDDITNSACVGCASPRRSIRLDQVHERIYAHFCVCQAFTLGMARCYRQLSPTEKLGQDKINGIANDVKQRCEDCTDINSETLALNLWSENITPYLGARLDDHIAHGQAH